MDQHFFGGTPLSLRKFRLPLRSFRATTITTQNKLIIITTSFNSLVADASLFDKFLLSHPPPIGLEIAEFDLESAPAPMEGNPPEARLHPIPSSWASKLLGEHFWHDLRYSKKSHHYFHRSLLVPKSGKKIDWNSLARVYDEDRFLVTDWEVKRTYRRILRQSSDRKAENTVRDPLPYYLGIFGYVSYPLSSKSWASVKPESLRGTLT